MVPSGLERAWGPDLGWLSLFLGKRGWVFHQFPGFPPLGSSHSPGCVCWEHA